jgi:flagellar assembly factor FliW
MTTDHVTLDELRGLTLPDGLVGLPELARFRLERIDDGPLLELVSADEPAFRFTIVPADDVRPDLRPALVERELASVQDHILVILSVHGEPPTLTANLAGPIVAGPDGIGRQVVLEDPAFPVRASLAG